METTNNDVNVQIIDVGNIAPTSSSFEHSKEPDVENGHDGGEVEEEEEGEPLTLMHYAETIEIIDYGQPMKYKTGVAGDTPDKDSFPFFKSQRKFMCLMWGGDVQEWRLLTFEGDKRPENIYDPEQSFNASYIMLKDINEIFLEVEPSCSFRIYTGENEVTRYTPQQPESREHADAWVNAIFAAMELQSTENDPKDLAELRQKYLDSFEPLTEEEQKQQQQQGEGALVNTNNNNDGESHIDLEAGAGDAVEKKRDERRDSTRTSKSVFEFAQIYGNGGAGYHNPNSQPRNSCCTMS